MAKELNRIKVALVEQKRTNRWLANELGKDEATVSNWCTNKSQPSLETIVRIVQLLKVDLNELIRVDSQDEKE